MNAHQPATPEFRTSADPRRHVPHIVYVDNHPDHHHPVWQISVCDHHDNHHEPCADTWSEALHTAQHWAHVNLAHGCVIYPKAPRP